MPIGDEPAGPGGFLVAPTVSQLIFPVGIGLSVGGGMYVVAMMRRLGTR